MYELRRSHVARAILGYLCKHPDAQDTIAGIAQWWLAEQKMKTRTVTIKEALAVLIVRGFVLTRKGTDSQIHYRINELRLKEIEVLLKQRLGQGLSQQIKKDRRQRVHSVTKAGGNEKD